MLLITTRMKTPVSHISCFFFHNSLLTRWHSESSYELFSFCDQQGGREGLSTKEESLTSSGEEDPYPHTYILLIHCHCDLCTWLYRKPRFPGGTNGKEPACQCRRCKRQGFNPWAGKILWRRAWQPTPVFLPGESHGQRSLAGYSL